MQDSKSHNMLLNEEVHDNENEEISHKAVKSFKKCTSLRDLSFVRIFDPIHVPTYLVKQIKGRLYDVEKFYDYQKLACTLHTPQGMKLNETNLLYTLVNEKLKQIKGFIWMVVDILTNSLVVQAFSMDREYWHKGEAIELVKEKIKKIMKDLSLKRVVWITTRPGAFEKYGFEKSKDTVMVYEEK